MSIVLNVSIRMYLPDVVGSTDDVVEKLTEVSNNISGGKLYFWYEEGDKVNIKKKPQCDFALGFFFIQIYIIYIKI